MQMPLSFEDCEARGIAVPDILFSYKSHGEHGGNRKLGLVKSALQQKGFLPALFGDTVEQQHQFDVEDDWFKYWTYCAERCK